MDYRPEKTDPYQTRLTFGRYRVNYPGDCGKLTVDLNTANLLLNNIVLKINAKLMTIDVKYFYLNTPMDKSKHMSLKLRNLPERVVQHYHIE